jgi:hypothetical protein
MLSPVSSRTGKTEGPVRSYRLTSLFGAAVIGIRPWEKHFPELYVLTRSVSILRCIVVLRQGSWTCLCWTHYANAPLWPAIFR